MSGLNHTTIKDLIKDPENNFFNYDLMTFARSRTEEIIAPVEGKVIGEIPKWIKGSFIQNGPGAFDFGEVKLNHVFDGMAMLHKYNFKEGKVTYQCQFIKSEAYKTLKSKNRMAFNELGTSSISHGSLFQKLSTLLFKMSKPSDNTLISVYPIGNDMFAFSESPFMHRFNINTLDTIDRVDLRDSINIVVQPGHPHIYDGKFYNCGLSITSEGSHYIIFHIPEGDDKFNNIEVISKIPARWKFNPCYMHSFGITENYFIIIEQPLVMSAVNALYFGLLKRPMIDIFKWLENENCYIHLVDRITGKVTKTFETEAFSFLHTINQYEKDGHVVLDLSCYKAPEVFRGFFINHLKKLRDEKIKSNMLNSRVLRFVMPLNVEKRENSSNLITLKGSEAKAFLASNGKIFCVPELLYDNALELATIWYKKYVGKYYRYIYGDDFDFYAEFPGRLIKVDVESKTFISWREENAHPSEPIFIPSPDAQYEDDGVIVSSLMYGDENRLCLVVLDAKNFKELGRCDFGILSDSVTKAFHGWFVDEHD